jgi:hypothetical protein
LLNNDEASRKEKGKKEQIKMRIAPSPYKSGRMQRHSIAQKKNKKKKKKKTT